MAKENIHVYQLEESPLRIEVFRFLDILESEHIHEGVFIPHRHDHYCCFFIESGYMSFSVDFQHFDLTEGSLLITWPGQVHELGYARAADGWMLAFDAKFVDQEARMTIEQSLSKGVLLQLNATDKKWFASLFELAHATVADESAKHVHARLMQTFINAFFYKATAVFQSGEQEQVTDQPTGSTLIVKKFQQLVKEHYLAQKKPADYAFRMNISVSYLNDTVKMVTGFSTTYHIQKEVFTEAQRLLFYTHKSVKEIAFQLGYEDYKYFIRLFGKTVGMSPTVFRNKNRP